MLSAQEQRQGGGSRCPDARSSSASTPALPLLAVERVTFTYGERPVELRRGLCVTAHCHYLNALG